MKNNPASVYMYFAHAVDTDLGTKPQKFLFSWQKKKRQKNVIIYITIFLSHIWVISVLENNSLDWVFIPTDIAGGMFEENELWMLQQWFVITFICSKSYFFCDATDAYAVSSFCLGQFSLNNCQLHSLLGCSFVFLYFANELWWLDLVKSFLQS